MIFHKTKSDRIFNAINIILMVIISLCFIIPFWIVLATSFLGAEESARRGAYQFYVEKIDLEAYRLLLGKGSALMIAYKNTFFRLIVGTVLNLSLTVTLAYGLSKRTLPGRTGLTAFVFITMLFSGGMIPSFILINEMGLMDSRWAMVLPGAVSAWNTILMRNFFMQIPESLEESALIDGATPMKILVRIILPLSLPAIATIGMFYAVGHWNAWFDAYLYINDKNKYPVQLILRSIVIGMSNSQINSELVYDTLPPPGETLKSAAIIATTLPIIFVYPFIQKYFVKGLMVGSVKG
jgi:putative aldouronate transport system permease protein